jgi:hypothetical protein
MSHFYWPPKSTLRPKVPSDYCSWQCRGWASLLNLYKWTISLFISRIQAVIFWRRFCMRWKFSISNRDSLGSPSSLSLTKLFLVLMSSIWVDTPPQLQYPHLTSPSNIYIALQTADVIAVIFGLAGLVATVAGNIIAYYSLKQLSSKGKQLTIISWGFPAQTNWEISITQIISWSSLCIICHPVLITLTRVATNSLFCLRIIDLCSQWHIFHTISFEETHTCCRYKGRSEIGERGDGSRAYDSETTLIERLWLIQFYPGPSPSTGGFGLCQQSISLVSFAERSFVHDQAPWARDALLDETVEKWHKIGMRVGSCIRLKDLYRISCCGSSDSRGVPIGQIDKTFDQSDAQHVTSGKFLDWFSWTREAFYLLSF